MEAHKFLDKYKGKVIILRGHKWCIAGESKKGSDYVTLERKHWKTELKRTGVVVVEIDVTMKEIAGRRRYSKEGDNDSGV